MKTHYRRLSKTALAKLRTDLAENGNKPSEYTALASFSAVAVGVETGGWIVVEVLGPDSNELPGTLCSMTFGGLKGAARSAVRRSKVRRNTKDEDGNDVESVTLIPENEVPEECAGLDEDGQPATEGEAVLVEGINPHRFA